MVRVVDVNKFLKLFADCFLEFAENEIRLYVEDCFMNQSDSGIYMFSREHDEVNVQKEEINKHGYDIKMTVSELAQFVFHEKGKKVFWAELV